MLGDFYFASVNYKLKGKKIAINSPYEIFGQMHADKGVLFVLFAKMVCEANVVRIHGKALNKYKLVIDNVMYNSLLDLGHRS